MTDKMKESFEKWASDNGFSARYQGDGFYEPRQMQVAWEAWQACAEAAQQETALLRQAITNIHDSILRGDSDAELMAMCDAALKGAAELDKLSELNQVKTQRDELLSACNLVLERIQNHPMYADLTPDEQERVGGDTAELAYLAGILKAAIAKVNS